MIDGIKVKIGEREYVVPPLSLGQLRNGISEKIKRHDELIQENNFFEALTVRGEVVCAALRRNYPDLDEAKLFDDLDTQNVGASRNNNVWLYVLGLSGFDGAGAEAGPLATQSGPSTGS